MAATPINEKESFGEHFEEREGQREMIAHICDAFNGDARALIEAGTGIGKSLAYLIPAVHWSLANNEKVILSTNTINLQDQLIKGRIKGIDPYGYLILEQGNEIRTISTGDIGI